MTELNEGDRYRDSDTGDEFVVLESVKTAGRSVRELDREQVRVRFEDGEELAVPHGRFRGVGSYEAVEVTT